MSDFKIITTHVKPPIPSQDWDYSAHFDGDEEVGPVGWGRDAAQAIEDLRIAVEIWDYSEPEQRARIETIAAMLAL